MKYESKRFEERWGTSQNQARVDMVSGLVGNYGGSTDCGGTLEWRDYQTGDSTTIPYNAPAQQWYGDPIPTPFPSFDQGQQAKAELEVLRRSLSFCLICGLDEVFVLCSLCRETVKEARQKMLDGMVESIRSISE